MKQRLIRITIFSIALTLMLTGCFTANSRLKKAKEGLNGNVGWQLLDANCEKVLFENPETQIVNLNSKAFPTLPVLSVGSSKAFGYVSILNLDDDDRDDISIGLTFIGKMDDAFSFYGKGKNFVGVRVSAVIIKDKKYHIYSSCKEAISAVPAFPYSKIEVTQEFRHAYHSYIGGVIFHEDLKLKLVPNRKEDQIMYVIIKKGAWFKLGS